MSNHRSTAQCATALAQGQCGILATLRQLPQRLRLYAAPKMPPSAPPRIPPHPHPHQRAPVDAPHVPIDPRISPLPPPLLPPAPPGLRMAMC
ncbi:hypothetical protein V8J88_14090 [Massilia sp. W12]|uniref:hypothetical protein n=1 Tax=Massilia sp. W12 TaxID=3126507 RepID=UPI0030CEEF04